MAAHRADNDTVNNLRNYTTPRDSHLQQWQNERENVRRRVFDEAWKAGVRAGRNNRPATDQAHKAAREAVAEYEKSNPEPKFSEPESRMRHGSAAVRGDRY